MAQESKTAPMSNFVVTKCPELEKPLPNKEILLLKNKIEKLEEGFEKLVSKKCFTLIFMTLSLIEFCGFCKFN